METSNICNNLKKVGFVNAGKIGLTAEEINELSNLAKITFKKFRNNEMKKKFANDYIPPKEGSEIVTRYPQQDPRAYELIEKLLNNKQIQSVLENVLGKNYKLRQIGLRRSLNPDRGLYLHQDAKGETNLGIMLTDNYGGNGSTFFLPSSHLVKTRMKVWNIETPPSVMKFFSLVMKKISGGKGDCFFFFNRTWHGRSPNYYNKYNDVILISFFPESAGFEIDSWDRDFLNSIKGSTFYNLININKVKSSKDKCSCNSFALKIEKNEVENTFLNKFKLFFFITTLRFLFKIYRTLKKVISFR